MTPTCPHENFTISLDAGRLLSPRSLEVVAFSAAINIACEQCGESFEFMGVPIGTSASEPTVNVDGTEVHLPMRPVSAPVGFGEDVPVWHSFSGVQQEER